MRIPSGVTTSYIYFVAVDATDLKTRKTGLTTFTVYRSRNGGAATAMTTPTISELSSANMPGVYELLLDEDMTIDAGDDTQEMVFHITATNMAPVTRTIELYRVKITKGETLNVSSGAVSTVTAVTTVNGLAANTVNASALAADAVTEIQTGLPTAISIADEVQTRTIAAVTTVNGLAVNSVNASALATDAVNEIADGILNRDMSAGTDSGSTTVRTVRQALRFLRNKWAVSSGTLTVYKEDDSTSSWTASVTGDANATPIIGSDPAGP